MALLLWQVLIPNPTSKHLPHSQCLPLISSVLMFPWLISHSPTPPSQHSTPCAGESIVPWGLSRRDPQQNAVPAGGSEFIMTWLVHFYTAKNTSNILLDSYLPWTWSICSPRQGENEHQVSADSGECIGSMQLWPGVRDRPQECCYSAGNCSAHWRNFSGPILVDLARPVQRCTCLVEGST